MVVVEKTKAQVGIAEVGPPSENPTNIEINAARLGPLLMTSFSTYTSLHDLAPVFTVMGD